MERFWVVGLIILGAGLLGGWAGYLADASSGGSVAANEGRHSLTRHLVLGVIAACSVPLFLSVLQSALMQDIFKGKPDQPATIPYVEFLVFAGFCLVAALSSRAFLDTLTKNVIRDVQDLKQRTRALDERVDENTGRVELVEEVVDREAGGGPVVAADAPGPMSEGPVPDVGATEKKALAAMMKLTYRTATGVGKDIGLSRTQIGEVLDRLAAKKLIERTTSPTTGGPRWRITALGARALNAGNGA